MKITHFLKYITASILTSAIVFYACVWLIPIKPYIDVLGYAVILFTVITGFVYWIVERALRTQQNNFFLSVIIINVFVKIVASFVFMMIYVKVNDPADRYFLVPFLMTYLIFTIFETYILSTQARSSK